MRKRTWIAIALTTVVIVTASAVTTAAPPGPEWPGTYMYFDDDGNLVGEANNALCDSQDSWGVVTRNVTARLGCGVSR